MGLTLLLAQEVLARCQNVLQEARENVSSIQEKLNAIVDFCDALETHRDAYVSNLSEFTSVWNDSKSNLSEAREIVEGANNALAMRTKETNEARSELERTMLEYANIVSESAEIDKRFETTANKLENWSNADVDALTRYQKFVDIYLNVR